MLNISILEKWHQWMMNKVPDEKYNQRLSEISSLCKYLHEVNKYSKVKYEIKCLVNNQLYKLLSNFRYPTNVENGDQGI